MSLKRASYPITDPYGVSGLYTLGGYFRVRIIKLPTSGDCDLKGFDVSHLEVGKVYETVPRLGELLIVCGYAEPEMRQHDRAADRSFHRK